MYVDIFGKESSIKLLGSSSRAEDFLTGREIGDELVVKMWEEKNHPAAMKLFPMGIRLYSISTVNLQFPLKSSFKWLVKIAYLNFSMGSKYRYNNKVLDNSGRV
jgi:hypothetical protein